MSDTIIFFTPEQIRQVRKELGITQAKFGKRVGNVTAGTVSRWEKGKMTPTQAHFKIIAQLAASIAAKQPAADAGAVEGTPAPTPADNSEASCHCPTCQRIDKMIHGLERRKQLLVNYKECVHSGLSGPLP